MLSGYNFTQDQQDLLMSLPYRVGYWVSISDGVEDEAARDHELKALMRILRRVADDLTRPVLVRNIVSKTLSSVTQWAQWSRNAKDIPAECSTAMQIIARNCGYDEADAFVQNMMEIAHEVAYAYCEIDKTMPLPQRVGLNLRMFFGEILGILPGVDRTDTRSVLNVSYNEDVAIASLYDAFAPKQEQEKKTA